MAKAPLRHFENWLWSMEVVAGFNLCGGTQIQALDSTVVQNFTQHSFPQQSVIPRYSSTRVLYPVRLILANDPFQGF